MVFDGQTSAVVLRQRKGVALQSELSFQRQNAASFGCFVDQTFSLSNIGSLGYILLILSRKVLFALFNLKLKSPISFSFLKINIPFKDINVKMPKEQVHNLLILTLQKSGNFLLLFASEKS